MEISQIYKSSLKELIYSKILKLNIPFLLYRPGALERPWRCEYIPENPTTEMWSPEKKKISNARL